MDEKKNELDVNSVDTAVAMGTAVLSNIPMLGTTIAEMIKLSIPSRLDRVVDFVKILSERVENLEEFKKELQKDQAMELTFDACNQAAKAFTQERKEYIANILKNSVTKKDRTYDEKKKLFLTLDSLNDSEIIIMKYYSLEEKSSESLEYKLKHKQLLRNFNEMGTDRSEEKIRQTYYESYNKNLESLGLVESESANFVGMRKRVLTPLGHLLLEYIED